MKKDWTIDTCVLYKAADIEGDAVEFLNGIFRKHHLVAIDHERHIENEYRRCLNRIHRKPGKEFVHLWVKNCIAKLIIRFSGNLEKRHRKKMIEMNFDDNDWPFVAVCSKTQWKNLVNEESDYNVEVKKYLKSKMEINVITVKESLEIF